MSRVRKCLLQRMDVKDLKKESFIFYIFRITEKTESKGTLTLTRLLGMVNENIYREKHF